jgi:hypothetical protein
LQMGGELLHVQAVCPAIACTGWTSRCQRQPKFQAVDTRSSIPLRTGARVAGRDRRYGCGAATSYHMSATVKRRDGCRIQTLKLQHHNPRTRSTRLAAPDIVSA